MITVFQDSPSIAGNYLAALRDVHVQQDKALFRRNLQRLGVFMACAISRHLSYRTQEVQTPLGVASCQVLQTPLVLGTILRAGLPMHQGFLEVFDDAESAFLSAYRKPQPGGSFEIETGYVACPDLTGKCLILIDPMLATGSSFLKVLRALSSCGVPESLHLVAAIASSAGLDTVQRQLPKAKIWLGAVDEELTAKSYIVPGLGDAGDLAFGVKPE